MGKGRMSAQNLHRNPGGDELKAFFDESGKVNSEISCIGGCVSSLEGWKEFEVAWSLVLNQYGIQWHHQVDWTHCRGQFAKWENDKTTKHDYQGNLLRIMNHFIYRFVGAAIKMKDYNLLSEEQKRITHDPYLPCLQVALHAAACEAKGLPEEDLVNVVIAENKELKGKTYELYELACQYLPDEDRRRLSPAVAITEMPKDNVRGERTVPLQAADLVAYEFHQYVRGKKRFPMEQLMREDDHYYWRIFDFEMLDTFCQPWTPTNHWS